MSEQTDKNLPLQGLKVIEMGQLIAGPFASKLLGEFGADVIKIEPPRVGDPLRKWRKLKDCTSLWWHVQSRNKRSVALDLRTSARAIRTSSAGLSSMPCRSMSWMATNSSCASAWPCAIQPFSPSSST